VSPRRISAIWYGKTTVCAKAIDEHAIAVEAARATAFIPFMAGVPFFRNLLC
jgi:hypothetical protein